MSDQISLATIHNRFIDGRSGMIAQFLIVESLPKHIATRLLDRIDEAIEDAQHQLREANPS